MKDRQELGKGKERFDLGVSGSSTPTHQPGFVPDLSGITDTAIVEQPVCQRGARRLTRCESANSNTFRLAMTYRIWLMKGKITL